MRFFWGNDEQEQQAQEEKIDYSHLSEDELLDSFKTDNWEALDEEHQIAIVQEMENRNASKEGREPAEVVALHDSRYYGQYHDVSNTLSINVSDASSYEVLDTYYHETNHGEQARRIAQGQYAEEHETSMMQAEMARDENGYLYNYAGKDPYYSMQCSEIDSNNKAAQELLAQKERYKSDPEYRDYIESRAKHFSAVNENLDAMQEERAAMQREQTYCSYVRGDISEEQYSMLEQNINNENYVDLIVQESHEVGDEVIELHNEFQQEQSNAQEADIDYVGDLEGQQSSEIGEDAGYVGDVGETESISTGVEESSEESVDGGYEGE